jgi:hypothetical protein
VSLCVGFGEKFKKTEKADKRELSKLSLSLLQKSSTTSSSSNHHHHNRTLL